MGEDTVAIELGRCGVMSKESSNPNAEKMSDVAETQLGTGKVIEIQRRLPQMMNERDAESRSTNSCNSYRSSGTQAEDEEEDEAPASASRRQFGLRLDAGRRFPGRVP